ncbi:hypothetical protein DVA43_17540 [Leclercia sp. W6]|uniref:hypothetical protein n=1 Tax=Leclercia sp. W6 TaxID=2282310 RepID=UPI000DF2B261|nr:hypothetical protein [Leclercia sp. W6]AXF58079.1 hypothetical protein DVA43_00105 [Leclercia sp. W6]AXF61217.1 hypothetical protein DVA43_17540 [Leclercia sp. W6]
MRLVALVPLLIAFSFSALASQVPASISKQFESLRVEKATISNKTLKVVYKDEKVGDLMALSIAQSVCSAWYTDKKSFNNNLFENIKVYNHWEMQGYQFNLNANKCEELGKLAGDEYDIEMRKIMKPL